MAVQAANLRVMNITEFLDELHTQMNRLDQGQFALRPDSGFIDVSLPISIRHSTHTNHRNSIEAT